MNCISVLMFFHFLNRFHAANIAIYPICTKEIFVFLQTAIARLNYSVLSFILATHSKMS